MVIFDKKCKITHSYYRIKGFKEVAIQKKLSSGIKSGEKAGHYTEFLLSIHLSIYETFLP